jgi:hypothetical protein
VRAENGYYYAVIPVLVEEDAPMVRALIDLSRDVMISWLEDNYKLYKAELEQATTIGQTVPLEAAFWNVWHWLFGITNRILVERGVFEDPYADHRAFKGFLPVVWNRAILDPDS